MALSTHRTHVVAHAVLTAVLVIATSAPACGNTLSYFARDASQEAMLSEMTIHPAAVNRDGITYLAFQGAGFDAYVATLDSASGAWGGPYRIGANSLRLDAHGAPSLFFDAAGYAHAFFGGHGTTIQHTRSTAPGSVSQWTTLASPGTGTYAQVLDQSGSGMLLFYRRLGSDWVYRASTDDAATFGPEVAVLDANADVQWYATAFAGAGDRVHLAFTWLDVPIVNTGSFLARRNLYYATREPTGAWQGADGTGLTMPISFAEAEAHCRIVSAGSSFVNEMTLRETESGDPVVLFLLGRGSGPGAYTWLLKRRVGDAWVESVPITTTDHYFDAATFERTGPSAFEVFLVTKDSDARGSLDRDYRGRGGRIERWTSGDGGSTWQFAERVSPAEPGIIYSSPVIVRNASADARVLFTDWTDDESNFFHRLLVWGDSGLVTREATPTVARIAGANRSATSVEVSKRAFAEGARYVVLATERDYPDAVAGTPLATTVNGPLLLTPPGYLPDHIAAEIRRLGATNAIVLGGTGVVSNAVMTQLRTRAGCTSVERVAGNNRYDTALAISRRMRDRTRTVTTAVVVSGRNWPDAVAVAPLAGANDWPIVLADGDSLPAQSRTILAEYGITDTLIVGQTDVVGSAVERAVPAPVRIGGDDRYATAALLAEYSLTHGLLPGRAVMATGAAFPDALSAGILGARSRAPLLLVRTTDVTAPARGYLAAHGHAVSDLWVVGGSSVIASSVQTSLGTLVNAY